MTDHPAAIAEREASRWSAARWAGKFVAGLAMSLIAGGVGYYHGREQGRDEMRCSIMAIIWDLSADERPGAKPPEGCSDYVLQSGDHITQSGE